MNVILLLHRVSKHRLVLGGSVNTAAGVYLYKFLDELYKKENLHSTHTHSSLMRHSVHLLLQALQDQEERV